MVTMAQLTITKMTRGTVPRGIPTHSIIPNISTTVSATVPVTISADITLNRISKNDITRIPP